MSNQQKFEWMIDSVYYGNTIMDYLIGLAVILLGPVIARTIAHLLMPLFLKPHQSQLEQRQIKRAGRMALRSLQALVIYIGTRSVSLPEKVQDVLEFVLMAIMLFYLVRFASFLIRIVLHERSFESEDGTPDRQIRGLTIILDLLLWPLAIILFMNNQGYNVTALLTGLGIGGIAIALAAQHVLADVFNYFVIFLDKPFEVGDFIILDDKMGTVEYIGIKTTRVKALAGEQLILANSDLTKSRIHNYKRMEQRRVAFSVKVPLSTKPEKLQQIPVILKGMIGNMAGLTFDRAHLLSIGEYYFSYEVVYVLLTGDYNIFADVQQAINLKMIREFEQQGIEFAIPTQIHRGSNGQFDGQTQNDHPAHSFTH